jgi:hypothetical protein
VSRRSTPDGRGSLPRPPLRALLAPLAPLALPALLAALASCSEPLDPPSRLDGLRVLAVKTEPPLARPGERVSLEMLAVDGAAGDPARRVRKLWLGGCHAPEGDLPSSCFDRLAPALRALSPGDLDDELAPLDGPAAGIVGFGNQFQQDVPLDAVARGPAPSAGVPRYGLSYVFFAACAGSLRPLGERQAAPHGLAITCLLPDGSTAPARDFVVGYVPIKAYDELRNQPPIIRGLTVAGLAPSGAACDEGAACPAGEACGTQGACVPVVPACTASSDDDCEAPPFVAIVGADSVELDPTSLPPSPETVWVAYFMERGKLGDDARLVSDPGGGVRPPEALASGIIPARGHVGPARLWAVARDNRLGVSWASQEILVR